MLLPNAILARRLPSARRSTAPTGGAASGITAISAAAMIGAGNIAAPMTDRIGATMDRDRTVGGTTADATAIGTVTRTAIPGAGDMRTGTTAAAAGTVAAASAARTGAGSAVTDGSKPGASASPPAATAGSRT